MDYKVVFIAHYATSSRGRLEGAKEFKTRWEAEKFIEDRKKKIWYERGYVEEKYIDLRSDYQKARDERIMESAGRYFAKRFL